MKNRLQPHVAPKSQVSEADELSLVLFLSMVTSRMQSLQLALMKAFRFQDFCKTQIMELVSEIPWTECPQMEPQFLKLPEDAMI